MLNNIANEMWIAVLQNAKLTEWFKIWREILAKSRNLSVAKYAHIKIAK